MFDRLCAYQGPNAQDLVKILHCRCPSPKKTSHLWTADRIYSTETGKVFNLNSWTNIGQ